MQRPDVRPQVQWSKLDSLAPGERSGRALAGSERRSLHVVRWRQTGQGRGIIDIPRIRLAPRQPPRNPADEGVIVAHLHTFRSTLSWTGSTAVGYDTYDRSHRVTLAPAAGELVVSAAPAFHGRADLPNPELLLLAAVSSCQLLSFLAFAARSRLVVLAYEDDAEALMPEDSPPMRITRVILRPRIVVAQGTDVERVTRLIERAHRACFIANSINSEIAIEAAIEEAH
jgi:organic hydroperoxide reductase OsmC/OhrA